MQRQFKAEYKEIPAPLMGSLIASRYALHCLLGGNTVNFINRRRRPTIKLPIEARFRKRRVHSSRYCTVHAYCHQRNWVSVTYLFRQDPQQALKLHSHPNIRRPCFIFIVRNNKQWEQLHCRHVTEVNKSTYTVAISRPKTYAYKNQYNAEINIKAIKYSETVNSFGYI